MTYLQVAVSPENTADVSELANLDEWRAHLSIGFEEKSNKTAMVEKSHYGPLVVQKPIWPSPATGELHLYLLHPPGGIVSGDKLGIEVAANQNAKVLLSSPGAAKFYRARGCGRPQIQNVSVSVTSGGYLDWLPHETIVFDGANGLSEFEISLDADATYMGWEIVCLGLTHQGESFDNGRFRQKLHVLKDGKLILVDIVNIHPENLGLHGLSTLAGNSVFATFIICLPENKLNDAESLLEQLREIAEDTLACQKLALTLVNDVIVIRYLGERSDHCKDAFIDLWLAAKHWCSGHKAIRPAIWNT